MKKIKSGINLIFIVFLIIFCSFSIGCSTKDGSKNVTSSNKTDNSNKTNTSSNSNDTNSNDKDTSKYTIKDYYPFKQNVRMFYKGTGNEYASKDVFVDFIKEDKIQLRSSNTGTVSVQVLQNKNGELLMLNSIGEFYYRDDLTSLQGNRNEVILKEPLVKGNTWSLSDGRKRTITGMDVSISTPSGNYKAMEITTEGKDSKDKDYYALNVGLVKSVFVSGGLEVTSSLEKVVKDAPVIQTIKFYYPRLTEKDVEIIYKKNEIKLNTNDEIKKVFEKSFKEPLKDTMALMSKNTKINSLYLNTKENKVYVDFSKEFVSEMNAGTSMEGGILKAVTNTLGDYYNVNQVYLTIDGKPYSSGHIIMKKGETLTVDLKDAKEVK